MPASVVDVVLVPRVGPGWGTGHLRRCADIAAALGERGALLLQEKEQVDLWTRAGVLDQRIRVVESVPGDDGRPLIVLDRRETSPAELEMLCAQGPVVGLDEGGQARTRMMYLLDMLPGGDGGHGANTTDPGLLGYPARQRDRMGYPVRRMLVSFGGEDPARLTESFCAHADRAGLTRDVSITLVEGAQFGRTIEQDGMEILRAPQRLREVLAEYDMVVTSFGLTAFEALAAGVPVVTLNPTSYHEKLARRSGLPSLGVGRPRIRRLARIIRDRGTLQSLVDGFHGGRLGSDGRGSAGAAHELIRIAETRNGAGGDGAGKLGTCPVCTLRHSAFLRTPERTYFRCPATGLVYAVTFSRDLSDYSGRYFTTEYEAQYGRTYLEDFDHIRELARSRLEVLSARVGPDDGAVLDVGCAYGPFLAEAKDRGYEVQGIDICDEAVRYVRRQLGIPAVCGDFADMDLREVPEGLGCISMWFVIEHFQDPGRVLRRANALLRPGGVLALSTPNGKGLSGRWHTERFLRTSPLDHFTIWSPATAKLVLGRYGFEVWAVRRTGDHPERSTALRMAGPRIGRWVSRALGLGETFEVYATKVRESSG